MHVQGNTSLVALSLRAVRFMGDAQVPPTWSPTVAPDWLLPAKFLLGGGDCGPQTAAAAGRSATSPVRQRPPPGFPPLPTPLP